MDCLAYSVRDAAKKIGVSENTVRKFIGEGRLSATRLDRRVLVRADSLAQLIEENTVSGEGH